MNKNWLLLTAMWCLVLGSLSACDMGGDEDESDDDTYDDNPFDEDDQHGDDDGPYVDDDTFYFNGQHEIESPYPLLVIGKDRHDVITSWQWDETSWVEKPIPASKVDLQYFGPTFFLNGEQGYGVWNYRQAYGGWYMFINVTAGHQWLTFTWEDGWLLDTQRPPTADNHQVNIVFAPEENDFWATSEYDLIIGHLSVGAAPLELQPGLFHYEGDNTPVEAFDRRVFAFYAVAPDAALAATRFSLWSYDGVEWTELSYPAAMRGGYFAWLWLENAANGIALWERDDAQKGQRRVAVLQDGEWSFLAAPPGCEDVRPRLLAVANDLVVATDPDAHAMFWERRNGTWSCRDLTTDLPRAPLIEPKALADGNVLFISKPRYCSNRLIVVGDSLEGEIIWPDDLKELIDVVVLGPAAPAYYFDYEVDPNPVALMQ